jgi:hypothetical protein
MAVGDTIVLQLGANIVDLGACFQTNDSISCIHVVLCNIADSEL